MIIYSVINSFKNTPFLPNLLSWHSFLYIKPPRGFLFPSSSYLFTYLPLTLSPFTFLEMFPVIAPFILPTPPLIHIYPDSPSLSPTTNSLPPFLTPPPSPVYISNSSTNPSFLLNSPSLSLHPTLETIILRERSSLVFIGAHSDGGFRLFLFFCCYCGQGGRGGGGVGKRGMGGMGNGMGWSAFSDKEAVFFWVGDRGGRGLRGEGREGRIWFGR